MKSKDISHLNCIIEEYISLDIINNEMLFDENTFMPEISKKYKVGCDTIARLSFNERRLDENIKKACDQERQFNEEFKMLHLHELHLVKDEIASIERLKTKLGVLKFKLHINNP